MRKIITVLIVLTACFFVNLAPNVNVHAQTINTTSIPDIFGSAIAINNSGEVLINGSSDINNLYQRYPIIWKDGIVLEVKDIGGWIMFEPTNSLNDKGEFIGSVYRDDKVVSFIYRRDTGIEYLPTVVDSRPIGSMYAYAINNTSSVAGVFTYENDSCTHVFIWQNGSVRVLDNDAFTCSTKVTDINDNNVIIGYAYPPESSAENAFMYDTVNNTTTLLESADATRIRPASINNHNHITGTVLSSLSYDRGFLWVGGQFTYIGTLGGTVSYAYSINENDEIAGKGFTAGDTQMHAFYWTGGVITDLGVLDYGDLPIESYGSESLSINNSGIIVGTNFSTDTQFSMSPVLFDYAVTKCKKPKKVQKDKDLPPPFSDYCTN